MGNLSISIDEKFSMLRCLVAIAHADKQMSAPEVTYLKSFIDRLPFSDEQRLQLGREMIQPQDVYALYTTITNPSVRAQILYFGRVLAYRDGVLHPSEEQMLSHLHLGERPAEDLAELPQSPDTAESSAARQESCFHWLDNIEGGGI